MKKATFLFISLFTHTLSHLLYQQNLYKNRLNSVIHSSESVQPEFISGFLCSAKKTQPNKAGHYLKQQLPCTVVYVDLIMEEACRRILGDELITAHF